ncbi:hypothetical protein ACA910_018451 [Epithemia clementina (nom. ined.)]
MSALMSGDASGFLEMTDDAAAVPANPRQQPMALMEDSDSRLQHVWCYILDRSTETIYTKAQVVGSGGHGPLTRAGWSWCWYNANHAAALSSFQQQQQQQTPKFCNSFPTSTHAPSGSWMDRYVLDALLRLWLGAPSSSSSSSEPPPQPWSLSWGMGLFGTLVLHQIVPYALTWYYSPTFYFTEANQATAANEQGQHADEQNHKDDDTWLVDHALGGFVPAWVLVVNAYGHFVSYLLLALLRRSLYHHQVAFAKYHALDSDDLLDDLSSPFLPVRAVWISLGTQCLEASTSLLLLVSSLQAVVMWEPATLLWVQAVLQFTYFVHVVWYGIYYQGQTSGQSPKAAAAAAATTTTSWSAGTLSLLVGLLSALHALVRRSTVVWYHVNLYPRILPFLLSLQPEPTVGGAAPAASPWMPKPVWLLRLYSWMERLWVVFASMEEESYQYQDDPAAMFDHNKDDNAKEPQQQQQHHHHRHGHVLTLGQILEFGIVVFCAVRVLLSLHIVLRRLTLVQACSAIVKLLPVAVILFVPWIMVLLEEFELFRYQVDAWTTATTLNVLFWSCTRSVHLAMGLPACFYACTFGLCGQGRQAWPVLIVGHDRGSLLAAASWILAVLWILYDTRWKRIQELLQTVVVVQLVCLMLWIWHVVEHGTAILPTITPSSTMGAVMPFHHQPPPPQSQRLEHPAIPPNTDESDTKKSK